MAEVYSRSCFMVSARMMFSLFTSTAEGMNSRQNQVILSSDGRGIVPTSFPVEGTLVFEPAAITCHTSHLFAVEIRDWVVRARSTRIHSVLLDSLEKATLLDIELLQSSPVRQSPNSISKSRAY